MTTFTISGADRYADFVEEEWNHFNDYTREESFLSEVERANHFAEVAIATEACVFERMFVRRTVPGLEPGDLEIDVEDYLALGAEARRERIREVQEREINVHGEELASKYRNADVDRIEELRQRLCIDSERFYKDKNILNLLRLARGRATLEVEGDVGAALLVRVMAETLRRFSEETFDRELPEEDELGFGARVRYVKVRDYGSHRLLDGERERSSPKFAELGAHNNHSARNFFKIFWLPIRSAAQWEVGPL